MNEEMFKATGVGLCATALLAILIMAGSRNLAHFDAALVAYMFASLAAVFAVAYRYTRWLQRPPTARYWIRGWQLFFEKGRVWENSRFLLKETWQNLVMNRFILNRGLLRGAAHLLVMWGTLLAAVVTFPLVFGWLYFIAAPDVGNAYQMVVFGFPAVTFDVDSLIAQLTFHVLVISSVMVIAGGMLAMRRRMRDRDAFVLQGLSEDILPLVLLFSISVTGLMLTVDYTWLQGYGYSFLAMLHAVTVILTLVWLPFGKFFHIFQRPAQLGVALYKKRGIEGGQARCHRCKTLFASTMQVRDLIQVQSTLGYRYEMPESRARHYQHICPRCRRVGLGLAHGLLFKERLTPAPVPVPVKWEP